MDTLTDVADPDLAIDTARHHLNALRKPALDLCRLLDTAHNQTAHIAIGTVEPFAEPDGGPGQSLALRLRRSEDRQPPATATTGFTPGPSR